MLNEKERLTGSRNTRDVTRARVSVKGIVSKRKVKQGGVIILLKPSLQCQKINESKETSPHLSLSELLSRNTRRIWWRKDGQNVAQNQQWQKRVEVATRRLPVTLLLRRNHAVGVSPVRWERTGRVLSPLSQLGDSAGRPLETPGGKLASQGGGMHPGSHSAAASKAPRIRRTAQPIAQAVLETQNLIQLMSLSKPVFCGVGTKKILNDFLPGKQNRRTVFIQHPHQQ